MRLKVEWWIDQHFWFPVFKLTERILRKLPDNYVGFWYALNEASWNRVCGGPQSAWRIFKIAMGWK